jgi:hypothetical protein
MKYLGQIMVGDLVMLARIGAYLFLGAVPTGRLKPSSRPLAKRV